MENLDVNIEMDMGLKESIHWRLFDLLDDHEIIVNIFVPELNAIQTGPFVFDRRGLVLDRLISHKDYTAIVSFNPLGPNVLMSHFDEIRSTDIHERYDVRTIIPRIEDGRITVDLLKEPRFDIELINELYEMIVNDVDVATIHILKSIIHPITQLVGDNQLMAMMYELSLDECYELTQAAYVAKFEYELSQWF